MERSRWTDERLDDFAETMRGGFDRVDRSFERVDHNIRDLRVELKAEISEVRQWIFRMTIGMSVGFISVLAAILARGA
ncbi:MAG TPA: hypothetical protein VKA41_08510 [Solirubrobacterales bacterium]|nr:hypothetical protein [Solirubrobacterales bacterium]